MRSRLSRFAADVAEWVKLLQPADPPDDKPRFRYMHGEFAGVYLCVAAPHAGRYRVRVFTRSGRESAAGDPLTGFLDEASRLDDDEAGFFVGLPIFVNSEDPEWTIEVRAPDDSVHRFPHPFRELRGYPGYHVALDHEAGVERQADAPRE